LKSLSEQYNLSVLPVSMDGGPMRPSAIMSSTMVSISAWGCRAGRCQRSSSSTLTKKPIPVGYGVMAADEVMQRIFTLTSVKVGSDY
jgi:conjugal transfer pilus assembly protein TraF